MDTQIIINSHSSVTLLGLTVQVHYFAINCYSDSAGFNSLGYIKSSLKDLEENSDVSIFQKTEG